MDEKLQKVLARAGVGSRRQMETWIEEGRITVNGNIATLGDRVSEQDQILVDGKPLRQSTQAAPRVIIYHKPEGEVCTRNDPEGRPTIFLNLPKLKGSRWISVGRLDLNTSGLLLLTNDGELANKLMHPSSQIEREYAVRILGKVSAQQLQQLQSGVMLEDGMANFDKINDAGGQGANHWYHVVIKEGRNREVRRLWEAVGLTVSRLIRVRYGAIELGRKVPLGKWQDLTVKQMKTLYKSVGLSYEPPGVLPPLQKTVARKKVSRRRKV